MPVVFWDASGLAKRYTDENGRLPVNRIFAEAVPEEIYVTPLGYSETYSILIRKHNSGLLDSRAFWTATNALRSEIIGASGFGLLSITDALIFGSLALMGTHNTNSADAAILSTYLRFQRASRVPCLLIASDKRLLRAAQAEGLSGLNLEEVAPTEVAGMLAES